MTARFVLKALTVSAIAAARSATTAGTCAKWSAIPATGALRAVAAPSGAKDLQVISQAIDHYDATHERLPSTLDELRRGSDIQVAITDPVTREPYSYEASEGTAYELSAVFELATTEERELHRGRSFSRPEEGRHCRRLRAERDRSH